MSAGARAGGRARGRAGVNAKVGVRVGVRRGRSGRTGNLLHGVRVRGRVRGRGRGRVRVRVALTGHLLLSALRVEVEAVVVVAGEREVVVREPPPHAPLEVDHEVEQVARDVLR